MGAVSQAMNELRNGWPSMVPRTLTRPRVLKNAAESGIITYVQPPLAGDFCRGAWKRLFKGPETFAICFLPMILVNQRRENGRVVGLIAA
jgi:hypothetical protein